jgi:hypothetical protein
MAKGGGSPVSEGNLPNASKISTDMRTRQIE